MGDDKARDNPGVPTRIVVGTDGSETAERAVWKATALAKALGAELLVVSAYRSHSPAAPAAGVDLDSGWEAAARSAAEGYVKQAVSTAQSNGLESVSGRAKVGEPASVLIEAVDDEKADLLVVGSKGMQSTARFLLGPIANKVSRRVQCDLLIVETSH
jgi:nucleotide-binding universal stress UspA family protein